MVRYRNTNIQKALGSLWQVIDKIAIAGAASPQQQYNNLWETFTFYHHLSCSCKLQFIKAIIHSEPNCQVMPLFTTCNFQNMTQQIQTPQSEGTKLLSPWSGPGPSSLGRRGTPGWHRWGGGACTEGWSCCLAEGGKKDYPHNKKVEELWR